MNSTRHQYTDTLIQKMKDKGIKRTQLKDHGFNTPLMDKVLRYEASFQTLIKLEETIEAWK